MSAFSTLQDKVYRALYHDNMVEEDRKEEALKIKAKEVHIDLAGRISGEIEKVALTITSSGDLNLKDHIKTKIPDVSKLIVAISASRRSLGREMALSELSDLVIGIETLGLADLDAEELSGSVSYLLTRLGLSNQISLASESELEHVNPSRTVMIPTLSTSDALFLFLYTTLGCFDSGYTGSFGAKQDAIEVSMAAMLRSLNVEVSIGCTVLLTPVGGQRVTISAPYRESVEGLLRQCHCPVRLSEHGLTPEAVSSAIKSVGSARHVMVLVTRCVMEHIGRGDAKKDRVSALMGDAKTVELEKVMRLAMKTAKPIESCSQIIKSYGLKIMRVALKGMATTPSTLDAMVAVRSTGGHPARGLTIRDTLSFSDILFKAALTQSLTSPGGQERMVGVLQSDSSVAEYYKSLCLLSGSRAHVLSAISTAFSGKATSVAAAIGAAERIIRCIVRLACAREARTVDDMINNVESLLVSLNAMPQLSGIQVTHTRERIMSPVVTCSSGRGSKMLLESAGVVRDSMMNVGLREFSEEEEESASSSSQEPGPPASEESDEPSAPNPIAFAAL